MSTEPFRSQSKPSEEKGDRLLRTETCLNDTYHLAIGRKLDNLPAIKQHLAATTDRYLAQQAELLGPPWIAARWLRWPPR